MRNSIQNTPWPACQDPNSATIWKQRRDLTTKASKKKSLRPENGSEIGWHNLHTSARPSCSLQWRTPHFKFFILAAVLITRGCPSPKAIVLTLMALSPVSLAAHTGCNFQGLTCLLGLTCRNLIPYPESCPKCVSQDACPLSGQYLELSAKARPKDCLLMAL